MSKIEVGIPPRGYGLQYTMPFSLSKKSKTTEDVAGVVATLFITGGGMNTNPTAKTDAPWYDPLVPQAGNGVG